MVTVLWIAIALAGQADAGSAEAEAAKSQQKKWNECYAQGAADYEISRGRRRCSLAQPRRDCPPDVRIFHSGAADALGRIACLNRAEAALR